MEEKKLLTWTHDFHWSLAKSISTCKEYPITLVWEANDPWKLFVREKQINDIPNFHAEDWKLAESYAEKKIGCFLT